MGSACLERLQITLLATLVFSGAVRVRVGVKRKGVSAREGLSESVRGREAWKGEERRIVKTWACEGKMRVVWE